MAEQLLLFANELRTRAKEILVRASSTDDLEAQEMMHVLAAGYQKLARRIERRVREAREIREAVASGSMPPAGRRSKSDAQQQSLTR
jgi:hypothetical protein